jgi:hypothetical protein
MTIVEIYLLGVLLAFILELILAVRIREISKSTFVIPILFHWLLLIAFGLWVYDIMGIQYEDLKKPEQCVWRIKRRK